MRFSPLAAITPALFNLFPVPLLTTMVLAIAPAPGDVVVEIKLTPKVQPFAPFIPVSPTDTPAPNQPFPSFNSDQLNQQWQRYAQYLQRYGAPDILIIGSSRALQGVDPFVLQQTLEQSGHPRPTVFNFGINGATAQVEDWLLHHLLINTPMPRLILWADGARAFNSGRVDHTFRNILASKGHQWLLANGRSPRQQSKDLMLGQVCMDVLALPRTTPTLATATRLEKSLTAPSTDARSPSLNCQQPIQFLMRQHPPAPTIPPLLSAVALGFQVVSARFYPAKYFQQYPRVPGEFDADYLNFSLDGSQGQALERVVQFANTRKIPLIIVNLPLTPTYIDDTRSRYEERFRNHMTQLAKSGRFTFIDLATIPALSQNAYFADPSHINRFGAIAIAEALGKTISQQYTAFFNAP